MSELRWRNIHSDKDVSQDELQRILENDPNASCLHWLPYPAKAEIKPVDASKAYAIGYRGGQEAQEVVLRSLGWKSPEEVERLLDLASKPNFTVRQLLSGGWYMDNGNLIPVKRHQFTHFEIKVHDDEIRIKTEVRKSKAHDRELVLKALSLVERDLNRTTIAKRDYLRELGLEE
jgi:hypothetical protein